MTHSREPSRPFGVALLLVFCTALISGVSTFVNFWAVQETNSDAFITVRNLLVALVLLPIALLASVRVPGRLRRQDWLRLATIGLMGGAIPFLLFFRGLQMAGSAGVATATFGYRTLFLLATVFAVVFLKERLSSRTFLAAVLLLGGNALLLSLTASVWSDGTVYVLAATVLWAGEYTLSKRTLRDLPSSIVALGRMGFGGIFLAGYLAASGQVPAVTALSAAQWSWVVISAILLVGFVTTWYAGLSTVDLSTAASVLVLAFPITWALGAFAGRSSVGIAQAAGVAAVVLGVVAAVGAASLRETWDLIVTTVAERVRSVVRL